MKTPPRMVTLDTFAKRLFSVREEKGLSQSELAKQLGIPKSSLCFYEKGKALPSLDKAYELAEKLGVSIDYLVGRDECSTKSISTVGDIFRLIQRLCSFECVSLDVDGNGQPILSFCDDGLNKIFGLQFELNREYDVGVPADPYCVKFLRSKEESIRAYEQNLDSKLAMPAPVPDYLVQLQKLENSKRRKYKDPTADAEQSDVKTEDNPIDNIVLIDNTMNNRQKAASAVRDENQHRDIIVPAEEESGSGSDCDD